MAGEFYIRPRDLATGSIPFASFAAQGGLAKTWTPLRVLRCSSSVSSLAEQSRALHSVGSHTRTLWAPSKNGIREGDEEGSVDQAVESSADLHGELAAAMEMDHRGEGGGVSSGLVSGSSEDLPENSRVKLVKLDRPPGRFDLLTNSLCYKWETTAAEARKVSGPLREWASELKYRTGVHMELEPTHPQRLNSSPEEGGYRSADEVEISVYLFGSERGIFNCAKLMESLLSLEPAYVRLGVFRRIPAADGAASSEPGAVEWLLLRRINRELRPPDIPPISLKLPGKYTLMYEHYKEAAIRTLWEETGIVVEPERVFPTGRLSQDSPDYYWRVPVYYFIAEVPYDVEVKGPQVEQSVYMRDWDRQLLQRSPDPIDRTWAAMANPETGCAWLRGPLIDELQRELRGEEYMKIRYSPPPYSELADVVGLRVED